MEAVQDVFLGGVWVTQLDPAPAGQPATSHHSLAIRGSASPRLPDFLGLGSLPVLQKEEDGSINMLRKMRECK